MTRFSGFWDEHRSYSNLGLVEVLFCGLSFLVWLYSVNSSKFIFGDNYGLLSSLGPAFYVAIALALVPLGLVCLRSSSNWTVGFIALFILQTELYLSFNFLWGFGIPFPAYSPNAQSYSIVAQINQQGGLQGLFPIPLSWPGAWILGSSLAKVTGIASVNIGSTMIVWLFLGSSLLIFFALMYRVSRDVKFSVLGGLCFIFGAWTFPSVFNDVGFSVPLFLCFLLMAFERNGKAKTWTIAATLTVVVSTVMANPYTAFSVLGVLAVYSIPFAQKASYKAWMPIFAIGVATFGLWYVLSGVNLVAAYSQLLLRVLDFRFLAGQLAMKYTGSIVHREVILAGEGLSAFLRTVEPENNQRMEGRTPRISRLSQQR